MGNATELDLAELLAMQPRRTGGPLAPGQRLPGGERAGKVRAQGSDFDSISPYMPGDDVRRIDWRATARSGRTQMRRVAASAHRARCVVLNLSEDLFFGTSGRTIAKTAALTAALKCWEALALNEPVGLVLNVDTDLAMPRGGQRHVERLLAALCRRFHEIEAAGAERRPAGLTPLMELATGHLHRRDELCVIDEFAPLDAGFRKLSATLAEQRSLSAVVIEDPMFRQALPSGRYAFVCRASVERQSLDLDEKSSKGSAAQLLRLRQEHHRALISCGWRVTVAVDILPSQGTERERFQ